MGDSQSIKKIGIFGHVGNKNLGDEAIMAAVIQSIKRHHPEAEIYGFTLKPEDTRARHNIIAFPIRKTKGNNQKRNQHESERFTLQKSNNQIGLRKLVKSRLKSNAMIWGFLKKVQKGLALIRDSIKEPRFLISCYNNLKGIDLLIIAGSQQLIDFIEGAWGHPYTLFKWSFIARVVKTKVAFLSVGAGPITLSLSKIFIKYALSHAIYRSYRDKISKNLIEQIGVTGDNFVLPDLAYSLHFDGQNPKQISPPIVGINPIPFSDPVYWPGSNSCIYEDYVKKLADFALWLIGRGYKILFFPTQLVLDLPVINDIRMCMKSIGGVDFEHRIIDRRIHSFEDLVPAISMTSTVIASRFHGVVIPFMLNKPVLGIYYHKKTLDMMAQMGQSEYALDINSFDCDLLRERFISLESNNMTVRREIEQNILIFRQALQLQYDRVYRLLEEGQGQSN